MMLTPSDQKLQSTRWPRIDLSIFRLWTEYCRSI